MKDKTQTITFWAVCIYLFCYFVRIFNFPNELTVILGGILCLIMVIQQKCIRINIGICLLTITMISYYVIINGKQGLFFSISYIPLVIYILTDYMTCCVNGNRNSYEKIMLLIFVFVLGFTLHGLLNSYMYYAGYVVPGTRRWQDFWSGEIVAGTQHAAYYLPVLALLFPSIIYFKKSKWVSIAIFLCSVFFCYTALITKSRMQLVIFVIVFLAQMVMYILLEREKVQKNLLNKKIWFIGIILLIALVAGAFLLKDSDIIVAFIANMGKGGGIFNNVRFQAQRLALEQLFVYPMGGGMMELGISHAHNVWLDIANAAGLIPFFAFTAYTIYSLYEMVCFLIKKEISSEMKIVMVGLYGAFFLYFTVETALEASVHLMTPWLFVNALVHGKLTQKNA